MKKTTAYKANKNRIKTLQQQDSASHKKSLGLKKIKTSKGRIWVKAD